MAIANIEITCAEYDPKANCNAANVKKDNTDSNQPCPNEAVMRGISGGDAITYYALERHVDGVRLLDIYVLGEYIKTCASEDEVLRAFDDQCDKIRADRVNAIVSAIRSEDGWDMGLLRQLCKEAGLGLAEEFDEADDDDRLSVALTAAEFLGVEIR